MSRLSQYLIILILCGFAAFPVGRLLAIEGPGLTREFQTTTSPQPTSNASQTPFPSLTPSSSPTHTIVPSLTPPSIQNPQDTNGTSLLDWLSIINIFFAILGVSSIGAVMAGAIRYFNRPQLNLEPDRGVSGSDYYLRFRVDNTGGRTAKTCVGRLIEAIDSQGKVINDFSMDFCWGQHNQEHEPEPEDILPHDKQYLDIAKCSTTQPDIVQLRVASKNPQLPRGDYHPGFRLWTPPVPPPYRLKIALYTEGRRAKEQCYLLEKSGAEYTLSECDPPT